MWDQRSNRVKCMGMAIFPLAQLGNFRPTEMDLWLEGAKREGGRGLLVHT